MIIDNPNGPQLFVHTWLPEHEPKAFLLVVHGLGEHGGRYAHLAEFFNNKDIAVWAPDHRGHGRTSGKRGHVNRLTDFVNDLERLRQHILNEHSPKPVFLMGHSMGGLIAFRYLLDHQDHIQAAILSAPAVGIKIDPPSWQKTVVSGLEKIVPGLTLDNGIDAAWLSHDAAVVEAYRNDPLVHPKISVRLFSEMDRTGKLCLQRAPEIKIPVMMIYGSEDKIIDGGKVHTAFERLSSSNKKELVIPNAFHEAHNEPNHQVEFEAIWTWLQPQLS